MNHGQQTHHQLAVLCYYWVLLGLAFYLAVKGHDLQDIASLIAVLSLINR